MVGIRRPLYIGRFRFCEKAKTLKTNLARKRPIAAFEASNDTSQASNAAFETAQDLSPRRQGTDKSLFLMELDKIAVKKAK